ncbi:MAG: LLM class flavin-dependent oxidoreductase [Actinomycetota bacterium]|mgnify:FL=1|jgi:probable F420-dependent oxidoreductase|nr:hypothetical protein [Acidimicrobiaceae bacterium]MEC7915703.1 LLM class flavin-dependent oxidoreductase [Actinomycetota bacterium]MEC9058000.1 LLM class flavin-dependent oxidoreductase [Actinomycetota bacterium]MEC9473985.1 LLM class flavin-dependent oxidoreductase [Actinomycetota bacterium]MEE3257314.1 LLM class flavin-dependent oxidoreductase [Actinomycetota bacterium]|tara:strand:- start:238 stop:1233 length:996 start_codon:yes stop_codon:yes gene_type:complete
MSDKAHIPLGITYGSLGVFGPSAVPEIAQSAAAAGYQSFWTVEATGTDAVSLLGAVSQAEPGLDLATGIMPIQLRNPSLAAMTAATLQSLNPGRTIWMGLGVSAPGVLHQHGIEASQRPIAMMREYVALMRECLSGESVTFQGDFWEVRRFRLAVRRQERSPKIVVAALNPQMLRLGGEIADAVLLNYIPPSHVVEAAQHIRAGGDALIMGNVHVAVADFAEAQRSARKDLFNYAMADGYANMFRTAGFGTEVDELRSYQKQRDREGALGAISEEMIQSINFIGTEGEVADFVRQYLNAGVEYPIVMPMPWGEDRKLVTQLTLEAAAAINS